MLSGGVRDPSLVDTDAHRATMVSLDPRLDPYRVADLGRGAQRVPWPLERSNDGVAVDREFAAVIRSHYFDDDGLIRVLCCSGGLVSKGAFHGRPADEVGEEQCDNRGCLVAIERLKRR